MIKFVLLIKRNYDTPELVDSEEWVCLHCTVSERACIFPLGHLNNQELYSLNISDSMEIANMIPVFKTASTAIKSNNLASYDIDENLVDKIIVNTIQLMISLI